MNGARNEHEMESVGLGRSHLSVRTPHFVSCSFNFVQ